MKRIASVLIFIVFLPGWVHSKTKYHYIDLDSIKIDKYEIENRNFHITNAIDGIDTSICDFGIVRKGAFNRLDRVRFKENISVAFFKVLEWHSITKPIMNNSLPYSLRIKNILFDERLGGSGEIANVILEVEYINDNQEIIYTTITKESHSGIEVTSSHEKLLQICVLKSLLVFNNFNKSKNTINLTSRHTIPILKEPLKKGIYGTFWEFKNNSPMFSLNFELHGLDDKKYLKKGDTNSLSFELIDTALIANKDIFISNIYGFCDGEKIFIREKANGTRFGFVEVSPKDRYLVFEGKVLGISTGAISAGLLFGGIVGGAILGAATSSGVKTDYIIDLMSGECYAYNTTDLTFLMEKNPLFSTKFETYPPVVEEDKSYWLNALNNLSNND
jgi:hypothetical protein